MDALAAAKVERSSTCRPLRDRALQERRRLFAMPRHRSATLTNVSAPLALLLHNLDVGGPLRWHLAEFNQGCDR